MARTRKIVTPFGIDEAAYTPDEEAAADAAAAAEAERQAAAVGKDNGEALDARRRNTKKEEINSLIEKDDLSGALKLALELIP